MSVLDEEGREYHSHLTRGDIGRYVFLPGDPYRTDVIAKYLDNPHFVAHNREIRSWTGTLNGEKVSVVSTGMGCPSTAITVEELIDLGADTFIRIGTAGTCKDPDDMKKYNCVICTGAVRDEGTSLQYAPIEYPAVANRFVVKSLVQAAEEDNVTFIDGITHSKDAFYAEVDPDRMPIGPLLKFRWQAWQKGNVVCSEMESAALFVISSIRGCRAGSIMNWQDMDKTITVACDAVRKLIDLDRKGC